jgi:Rieske 2Fe-2S family protein
MAPVFPPAPVDHGALAETLRPFGESVMLPPAAYTDPAVFQWERRHFFGGGWVCAALGTQLPSSGDQLAVDPGVLLVRGEDGVARAFANTCPHRGHELLPYGSPARAKAVVCPYHSWAFSLSGELRGAPGYRDLDTSRWSLTELPTVEWHGLIFTDMSGGGAGDLPLSALDGLVAPYEPERNALAATHTYDCRANWKVLTENYSECYHCPTIHPELCQVSPPHSGENYATTGAWTGGWMRLRDGAETMSLDGRSDGVPLRGLSGEALRTVIYVAIFPNVLLSLHPDYVMTHLLRPVAANRTVIECGWSFAPEAVSRPGFAPGYAADFWDLTNRQDWAACESVQRGLASPFAAPGPLAVYEDAVYSFVTTVARGYLGERVTERPSPEPAGLALPALWMRSARSRNTISGCLRSGPCLPGGGVRSPSAARSRRHAPSPSPPVSRWPVPAAATSRHPRGGAPQPAHTCSPAERRPRASSTPTGGNGACMSVRCGSWTASRPAT